MAVPFVSRKRLNPRNLEAEGKFYPAPAYISEIGVNQIAEEIALFRYDPAKYEARVRERRSWTEKLGGDEDE